MEAHTPKREAVEKFIASQAGHGKGWHLRVVDEQESPLIRLEATNPQTGNHPKTLEIHTRQITLTHEEVDESTKKLILRWIDSLSTGTTRAQA